MNSRTPRSSSFDELDKYTNQLENNQIEELLKDFDETVAIIEYEELLKNGANLEALPPTIMFDRVSLPSVSHTMRSNPFDPIPVDYGTVPMITNYPRSNPNSYSELYYEPVFSCACAFGTTQPCTFDTPTESIPDFDLFPVLPSNEKAEQTPQTSPHPNPYEWLIEDETGKKHRPLLFEFFRQLLDNVNYSHIAVYIDRKQGIFKILDRKLAADLWQHVKGRNSSSEMTYDKLARGIRYYYSSGIIRPSPGRFTFRFGSASGFGKTWLPV